MEGKAENRAKRNTSPVYGIVGFTDTDNTVAERRLFTLSENRKTKEKGYHGTGKAEKQAENGERVVTVVTDLLPKNAKRNIKVIMLRSGNKSNNGNK